MTQAIDENWERTACRSALDRYSVIRAISDDAAHVRLVEAEAGTGSRYVVVATMLPPGHGEGGNVLVTVLWPWQTAWTMQTGSDVHSSYVAERFANPHRDQWHAGDLAALTETIALALGRRAVQRWS